MPRISLLILFALALGMARPASAQNPGSSSSKSKQKAEQHVTRPPTPAAASAQGAYRNPEFDFAYRIPYAWVDRTKEMQEEASDPGKSQLLLAVFERPPEVTGDTVNSAVVIAVESATSYPGLKTAADYMGPLTELTISKGFTVTQQPYEFPVRTTHLVRSDFAREMGKLTMHQSSLVFLHKGFVVSFTFIGGSEDEVEELIEKLSFGGTRVR
jgi:hypothetical protein